MKLLVFNYSMNQDSLLFSHQPKVVERLIKEFEEIDVVTADTFSDIPKPRVRVFSVQWQEGRTLINIYKFLKLAIPLLWKHRKGVLFSHMTDVQSSLVSPICRLLRIKHVLWYAHKKSSLYLNFSYPFLSSLVTSSAGSCPKTGKKVVTIGQAIDNSLSLQVDTAPKVPPTSWYHVGRIDESKNLDLIIESLSMQRHENPEIRLHFYGAPSSAQNREFFYSISNKYREYDWIAFHGKLLPEQLAEVSKKHDAFIHAFWGSLDKALLEAISLKRIVVSANPEYIKAFHNRNILKEDLKKELRSQIIQIYSASPKFINDEIERKSNIVMTSHTLDGWVLRLSEILKTSAGDS
jgi:glycosyltransferase involved in cell wall biosynthesis